MLVAAQCLVGLVLLYAGGETLVRGAGSLARRFGLSELAIGLTVVAFGTSAPELVVSVDAALSGVDDIAVGNVVGSNIANIGLILGLAVLITPAAVAGKLVRIDGPLMIIASLALVAVLANDLASAFEGMLLVGALVVFVAVTLRQARREPQPVRDQPDGLSVKQPMRPALGAALVALGLILLVGGGHLLVSAAVVIASNVGVSQAVIGLTIVAVGTSLPELATSVVAAARGQGDIAVGNVVGSNIFNIIGILGLTAIIQPLERGAITAVDLGVMTVLAIALTVRMATTRTLGRVDGLVLLLAYGGYTTYLIAS